MIDLHSTKHSLTAHRREWLQALILLGLGLYFVVLIVGGNLNNYINARFSWLSYIAAAVFLLLSLWRIQHLLREHHHADTHTHHTHLSWGALIIVALPLVIATLIPSQPLGAEAVSGGISLEPISGVRAEASYSVPPEKRNVLDWLRVFDEADNPAELDGLPVDIVGFVYREPDMDGTQFMAARFTLSCCVADALAIGLPVQYDHAPDFADGAWVHITGVLEAGEFRGDVMPIVRPEQVEAIEQPANPYLYS